MVYLQMLSGRSIQLFILVSKILIRTARTEAANGDFGPNLGSYHIVSHSNGYGPSNLLANSDKRPHCAGASDTYCTHEDHYPTELIENLIKRNHYNFQTLLQDETHDSPATSFSSVVDVVSGAAVASEQPTSSNDTLPNATVAHYPTNASAQPDTDRWWTRSSRSHSQWQKSVSATLRVVRQAGGNALCPTTQQYIAPKVAINTKGKWMYIVNLESNKQTTQVIQIGKCSRMHCSGICQIPSVFVSSCMQKFVQKRLVALSSNSASLNIDTFWFPYGCNCEIERK